MHIVAVVMVLVFIFSISIVAYLSVFFDAIKTAWEDSFLYRYIADNKGDEKPEPYVPVYISESYIFVGENVMGIFSEYIYDNKVGDS